MNKREEKKEAILLAGINVMKSSGYNGTSVKDIVDEAKVPKGSFYNYFESKEAFAIEAIEYIGAQSYEKTSALLSASGKTPVEGLRHFFECGTNNACADSFKVGCFLGNMCQEMSDTNAAIREKLRHTLKKETLLIAKVIDDAKTKGEINPSLEAPVAAEFLFNAWEGALMRMKASQSREPLDAFLAMLPVIFK